MWDILRIICEIAGGILVFQILSLLVWDLVGLMPAPWERPASRDLDDLKSVYRVITFLVGCVLTGISFFWAGSWFNITWSYLPLYSLLLGFSVPVIVIFVARLTYAIMLGIFTLYSSTEVFYDGAKNGLVAVKLKIRLFMRKKGLSE